MFAIAIAVATALLVTGAAGTVWFLGAIVAFLLAVIGRGVRGSIKKVGAGGVPTAGKLGRGDWWVVLAVVLAVVEIGAVTAQLIHEPKWENAVALGIVGGLGTVALTGTWYRSRSRSLGDWMIVVGVLPFFALFWMVWPPIVGVLVIAMALIDSATMRRDDVASA